MIHSDNKKIGVLSENIGTILIVIIIFVNFNSLKLIILILLNLQTQRRKKGEKSHEKKIDTFKNLGWKVSEKRFSLLASSASEFTFGHIRSHEI